MKKYILILFLITYNTCIYGQLSLQWAKRAGSTGEDVANCTKMDASGNIYTVGEFTGTVDFDMGSGVAYLTAPNQNRKDIFITKTNASGGFEWAKRIGGGVDDFGKSIAIDASGNVFVTGAFYGSVDFDPGNNSYVLISNGIQDIFVLKLNSSGDFQWAKAMGGAQPDYGLSITVDNVGNVYTTGSFRGTADFDPSSSIYNLASTSIYDDYMFVSKLNSSGNFVWAKNMGAYSARMLGQSIITDATGYNVYITGTFERTVDFDPGSGTFNMTALTYEDQFICKLNSNGDFQWAKQYAGTGHTDVYSMTLDNSGNLYTTGYFAGTVDFDPSGGSLNITSTYSACFVSKSDPNGNIVWVKHFGGITSNTTANGYSITTDNTGDVYIAGTFRATIDFNPGSQVHNMTSDNGTSSFIIKLDASGNFIWANKLVSDMNIIIKSILIDGSQNIYTSGYFYGTADLDPGSGFYDLTVSGYYDKYTLGYSDFFIQKIFQKGVLGRMYNDLNQDCILDNYEVGLKGIRATIQPGNIIVETNEAGIWQIDYLPIGNYTISVDTSGKWKSSCPIQNFSISTPNTINYVPSIGLKNTDACPLPEISVHIPFMRPGFSDQKVYINACNLPQGSDLLYSAYAIVELDPLMYPQSGSQTYTSLGGNKYRFNLGTMAPGMCTEIWLSCSLSNNAVINSTLCVKANLFPVDSCTLDTLSNTVSGVAPCTTPWDKSSLKVMGKCTGDSNHFVVKNSGSGNMTCYSPVRIYVNGIIIQLDSVLLAAGDSTVYTFLGDGKTWRLEADQHPLHPGNSKPNATIENCNPGTWTSNLVSILPNDDADPGVDIVCIQARGSYDPNDKTGYPIGVTQSHFIQPNQEMDYMIRFQNTGTDTAFTVVIRDTLDMDMDIYSVVSGTSSHSYKFRMYGPRILEWTFSNIQLPDSNVNEPKSHGFVSFKVNQKSNLSNGTLLTNKAAIYFDYNAPIITNASWHTINNQLNIKQWNHSATLTLSGCDNVNIHGNTYTRTGNYYHIFNDTLFSVDVTINNKRLIQTAQACGFYNFGGNTLTKSGVYFDTLSTALGCDSIIELRITFPVVTHSQSIAICTGESFTIGSSNYSSAGTYIDTLLAVNGCDSIVTTSLTLLPILQSTQNVEICYGENLTVGTNTYDSTGTYTDTFISILGCDSVLTTNLTVKYVNTNVTPYLSRLTAHAVSATYQWIDCANGYTPISGETNKFFVATSNGIYAVIITKDGCSDTSACYNINNVGFESANKKINSSLTLFPNPASVKFTILNNQSEKVEIHNMLGVIVKVFTLDKSTTKTAQGVVDISDLPKGMYIVKSGNESIKLIVE